MTIGSALNGTDEFITAVPSGAITAGDINYNPTNHILTITAVASPADYQAVLSSITYNNISLNPSTAPRAIEFIVNDGARDSSPSTQTVTITIVRDAPIVIPGTGNAAFNLVSPVPVRVAPALTVTDVDSANLSSATVRINNLLDGASESLGPLVFPGGITGVYTVGTGTLTLTGTSSLANYQSALRSVVYNNTAGVPNSTDRQIDFQVFDDSTPTPTSSTVESRTDINTIDQ